MYPKGLDFHSPNSSSSCPGAAGAAEEEDDDDVPDLVENFDEASKGEEKVKSEESADAKKEE